MGECSNERPEAPDLLRGPPAGGQQRTCCPSPGGRQKMRRLCLREHTRALDESGQHLRRAPARPEHRVDGHCDLLHDEPPVRDQPLPARARGRGRLQLCQLRHRARRLYDDQPLRGKHGTAQDHGRRQGPFLLRVHGDPAQGRRQWRGPARAPVQKPHPQAPARRLRHGRVRRRHPQGGGREQPRVRAHPRARRLPQEGPAAHHGLRIPRADARDLCRAEVPADRQTGRDARGSTQPRAGGAGIPRAHRARRLRGGRQ